ncbi:hypothetical protein BRC19_03285 [Candidatus Saccharibacteria bacterium QS_5_54_17]|nr:MAG: hypothetical protein BRC19_03285 [Candidatus Saccharibacteria bacterium QS_5_54_17]
MRHLSEPDIVYIHDRIIDATGGDYGIRDKKLLASICERPKTALSTLASRVFVIQYIMQT